MSQLLAPVTYELSLSEGDDATWVVTRVWIREALSEPFHAIIDVETDAEHLDTDTLLGCDAVLTLSRGLGSARSLCGLVSRLDLCGYDHAHLMLRVHVVPVFELLGQRVNSRIWQHQSALAIVTELLAAGLGEYGRELQTDGVRRGAQPRDYCVQYRESDFAFVSRLLEEEGISYEFTHAPESKHERLTLRDANAQYTKLENTDGTAEIPIILSNPDEADIESIQNFEWSKQLTSTAALRVDYDWKLPRNVFNAAASGLDDRQFERRVLAHGTRRLVTDDLAQQANDLRHASSLAARVVRGRSNVSAMRPGLRFSVSGHYRFDLEREYLITQVVHTGAEPELSADPPMGIDPSGPTGPHTLEPRAYANEFACVPIDAVVRPLPLTPKPREYGPQPAIVTGPEGEEIHTDQFGRIQVQFYWEERPRYQADSSCWVRCSQSWAGAGWGAQFIPRIGMEVIVEFLEGNPDRPIVTGCVYNSEYPPPFALPAHKTQSGWRTESTPGGRGNNELRFEDAAGSEEIYLHGEKDWAIAIENDKTQTVGNDETLEVGHDRSKQVGNDEQVEIGNDHTGNVGNDQTLSVGNDQRVEIGNLQHETIGDAKTVEVGTNFELDVGKSMTTRVSEDASTSVGGDRHLEVEGDANERITNDKFVESTNATTKTSDDMRFEAGKSFHVKADDDIGVDGQAKIVVEAKQEMVFKCGAASITLEQGGKIVIKGTDVTVKGSGNLVLKGQTVAEN